MIPPYAAPIEFGDQYLTATEYAQLTGRSLRQVRRMAKTMVFSDFGIPIIRIPRGACGQGRRDYGTLYIFSARSQRS